MSHQENTQRLVEEIDRLKQLVKDAYMEAYYTASFIADGYEQMNQYWESSQVKRELEIDPNIVWVTLG